MSRGRKPSSYIVSNNWGAIFWNNLPTYIRILNKYFINNENGIEEIGNCIEKLSFSIPKGLNSKEINSNGIYPVISQSKEYIIGYSDRSDLLVDNDLPLIIFGDHSKTIKFVENPFIIGADGVKLIKPKKIFNEKFFYYFLYGVITDTKDYGRHYSLIRKGYIPLIKSIDLQKSVVKFLDDLKLNNLENEVEYFNKEIEDIILSLQINQIEGAELSTELGHQLTLVKKLRQQLLQDAVQGKLVAQNKKDEPANELLKKIKDEKEKLIAEKKLKKEKTLPPIKPEEIPFEIPENWGWCRMSEICNFITDGDHQAPPQVMEGVPFIVISNIKNNHLRFEETRFVLESYYNNLPNEKKPQNGDILYTVTGSFGIPVILEDVPNFCVQRHIGIIKPNRFISNKWLYFLLKAPFLYKQASDVAWGIAQRTIPLQGIRNFLVPVAPFAEQTRIVQKLEELMQFCNELEASIKESKSQNEKLLQQVLREALRGGNLN